MDFFLTLLILLNALIVVASFCFAFILLCRRNDPITFNFGMANLFLGLWVAVTLLTFISPKALVATLITVSFIFGLLIMHFFYIFALHFPLFDPKDARRVLLVDIISGILVICSISVPGFLVLSAEARFPYVDEKLNISGTMLFTLYFLYLSFASVLHLVKKYGRSDGLRRRQLVSVIVGTSFALICNLFLSYLSAIFLSVDLTLLGSLSAFAVIVYIYLILVF